MKENQTELMTHESIAGLWVDHLKAARIPLMIIAVGAVVTVDVDQIGELFFLLANTAPLYQEVAAVLMALLLGIVVWHTTRTIYRFDLPGMPALQDSRGDALRKWLPRVLGAAVPLLMLVGYVAALRLPTIKRSDAPAAIAMPIIFLAEDGQCRRFGCGGFHARSFGGLWNALRHFAGCRICDHHRHVLDHSGVSLALPTAHHAADIRHPLALDWQQR